MIRKWSKYSLSVKEIISLILSLYYKKIYSTFITGVTIGFERTAYSVEEGDVVEVCAVLTGTLEKLVEVSVSSSSGSATGTHQI